MAAGITVTGTIGDRGRDGPGKILRAISALPRRVLRVFRRKARTLVNLLVFKPAPRDIALRFRLPALASSGDRRMPCAARCRRSPDIELARMTPLAVAEEITQQFRGVIAIIGQRFTEVFCASAFLPCHDSGSSKIGLCSYIIRPASSIMQLHD
jgi:hypothetical protein